MEKIINGLNCHVKQTNTKKYKDYKITDFFVLIVNLKQKVRWELSVTVYFKDNINSRQKYFFPYANIPVTDTISIYWELLLSFLVFILRVNYIPWHIEKIKIGSIKWIFKNKTVDKWKYHYSFTGYVLFRGP